MKAIDQHQHEHKWGSHIEDLDTEFCLDCGESRPALKFVVRAHAWYHLKRDLRERLSRKDAQVALRLLESYEGELQEL